MPILLRMALKCLQGIPDGPEAFSSPRDPGRRRRLVFMGDSRIRQIYEATVRCGVDEKSRSSNPPQILFRKLSDEEVRANSK